MPDTINGQPNPNKRIKQLTRDLTVGKPSKNILNFAVPVMIGYFFQLAYNWADAIIIGQFMGSHAFGAVTATSPVINLFITLTMGFMTGAAVVLGQLFGSKNYENLKKAQTTIIICMLVACAILMAAGVLLTEPLLRLLNVSETQFSMSAVYLKIYFIGIIAMAFYNTFTLMLQAVGNSVTPLIALMISTAVNICLDILFVGPLGWGIAGAAVATVAAQAASALFLFIYIQKTIPVLKIKRKEFTFDKTLLKSIARIAFPSMVQQFSASLGFLAVNSLINKNGAEFTTAFGVGNKIDELMSMIIMSFGAALTAFSAQNKGVGDIERIKKGLLSGTLMCAAVLLVFGSVLMIFRRSIIQVFINIDPALGGNQEQIINLSAQFMLIMLPSFFFLEIMFLLSSVLRGSGAAIAAMEINVVSLISRVAAAFLFDYLFGYVGVFFASPAGWFIGMIWAVIQYSRKKWTKVGTAVTEKSRTA